MSTCVVMKRIVFSDHKQLTSEHQKAMRFTVHFRMGDIFAYYTGNRDSFFATRSKRIAQLVPDAKQGQHPRRG